MDDDDYDELFYSYEETIKKESPQIERKMMLPAVVKKYVIESEKISNYNEVPAAVSFFVILGQIVKDLVAIPNAGRLDDIRIQFLWLQTSGTGKSTLTNFYIPILRNTFEKINTKHGTKFDIFDITDYTHAALIGSMDREEQEVVDEDGNVTTIKVDVQIPGQLEGDGLAIWDEFEYSGVFNQSQHKQNAIVYLNTFMNTIHGETWIIKKKLRLGDEPIECKCRRSVYGTSYIPKNLNDVIHTKGVLQRLLMFVYEVPQHQQESIRRMLIKNWGKKSNTQIPIEQFSNNFVKLYDCIKEKYEEMDSDMESVVTITKDAQATMERECILMEKYVSDSRPEVIDAMNTFINRTLMHLQKLSVLCCVAEAPSISDKTKRFKVTSNNVLQASSIIRQCYKSLVDWLDEALTSRKSVLEEKANLVIFKKTYRDLSKSTSDGWVNKKLLLNKIKSETKKSASTIYKWWPMVEEYFDEQKLQRSVYLKLKEDNK